MTAAEPPADLPTRAAPAAPGSRLRRTVRGLLTFAKRSPMSAFWGVIAVAIIAMALCAPMVAPYEPLKSDFRAMTKPPDEKHFFGTDQIGRDT